MARVASQSACYRGSSGSSGPRPRLGSPKGLWGLSARGLLESVSWGLGLSGREAPDTFSRPQSRPRARRARGPSVTVAGTLTRKARACAHARHACLLSNHFCLLCQNEGSLRHRRVICLPQKKKSVASHIKKLSIVAIPGLPLLMPKSSQSEILAKFFSDMGEKLANIWRKTSPRFSSCNFQQDWRQESSRKILGQLILHAMKQNSFTARLWELVGTTFRSQVHYCLFFFVGLHYDI